MFNTVIDHNNKMVDMETLPYTTFIESYSETVGIIIVIW